MISILLYHGTMDVYADDIVRNGINLRKSKPYLDFGPGFYTTPEIRFALNTAEYRAKRYNMFNQSQAKRSPAIVVFECQEEKLSSLALKHFSDPSEAWGRFVLANRITSNTIRQGVEHNCDQRYDCVIGPTADGRSGEIETLLERLDNGEVLLSEIRTEGIAPSRHVRWGLQYSFHTAVAIDCLMFKAIQYDL